MLEFAAARSGQTQDRRFNEAALTALGVPDATILKANSRVAIGFADYGFDLMHPCLRGLAGDASRFCFLWDQNRTPEAVALASGAIASALAQDPNAKFAPLDPSAGWSSRFGFGPLSIAGIAPVGVST